jgi:hypothetical protein
MVTGSCKPYPVVIDQPIQRAAKIDGVLADVSDRVSGKPDVSVQIAMLLIALHEQPDALACHVAYGAILDQDVVEVCRTTIRRFREDADAASFLRQETIHVANVHAQNMQAN